MTALTATAPDAPADRMPAWAWAAAALGLAWNAFGLKQFVDATFASKEHMLSMGMTAAQAELYAGLPAWMTAAFALGVGGGLMGCALLLVRRRLALPVLLASLVSYVVLFVGDVTEGVFAAFGAGQVAILTLVVLIAAALLGLARRLDRRGALA